MESSKQSFYVVGSFLVVILIAVVGYLWYQNQSIKSIALPTTSQPSTVDPRTAPVMPKQDGVVADTPLLGIFEIGSSRIPTISGIVESVDLIDLGNPGQPEQYFVVISSLEIPEAKIRVGIGHAQYMTSVRYTGGTPTAGKIVEENMRVRDLVEKIIPGEIFTADLTFPQEQPEIRSTFMDDIKAFEAEVLEGSNPNPFNVHYFRVQKIALPQT